MKTAGYRSMNRDSLIAGNPATTIKSVLRVPCVLGGEKNP
jgi:hypothetical protein